MISFKKIAFTVLLLSFGSVSYAIAQDKEKKPKTKKVNFGYSTNPPAKIEKKDTKKSDKTIDQTETTSKKAASKPSLTDISAERANKDLVDSEKNPIVFESVSVAKRTREVAKKASKAKLSPTEIYKVGIGDVLFINLQNASAKYYTILIDGTIDYPLAGKLVSVIDLTTEEIEDLLREKVTLYENPQVTVKVREYASHKIKVEGVAKAGEYFLQREAMPLVVVKTMAGVNSSATRVVVEREGNEPKLLHLDDSESNSFLIQTGDVLKFETDEMTVSNGVGASKFYFIAGKICKKGGKKKFHEGITLVQALFDACDGLNGKLKLVKISRKTASGKFISKEYDFKEILEGKQDDPTLKPGDMINSGK